MNTLSLAVLLCIGAAVQSAIDAQQAETSAFVGTSKHSSPGNYDHYRKARDNDNVIGILQQELNSLLSTVGVEGDRLRESLITTLQDALALLIPAEKAAFVGTWKLIDSKNYDDYLKELGVGFADRQVLSMSKPTLVISFVGNKWKIKEQSTFRNTEINFVLDEEFEETTFDGRKVKSKVSLDGDILFQTQKAIEEGVKDSQVAREISNGRIITTLTSGDVVAVRHFERV